jgi:predicted nucleic acid-binding protein
VVNCVLDASAILRYLDDEAGAERMTEVMEGCFAGENRVFVSSVQWGEVACALHKRHGVQSMEAALTGLLAVGVEVVPATQQRAVRSGIIKATRKIPYADAFAVELASDSPDCLLITADFDLGSARRDVKIEFLPTKKVRT